MLLWTILNIQTPYSQPCARTFYFVLWSELDFWETVSHETREKSLTLLLLLITLQALIEFKCSKLVGLETSSKSLWLWTPIGKGVWLKTDYKT